MRKLLFVIRLLALSWRNRMIAAIACVPLACLAAYAAVYTDVRPISSSADSQVGSPIAAYTLQSDYMDCVPQKQSDVELGDMSNKRLALYLEILMLFFASVIAVGGLLCHWQTLKEGDVSSHALKTAEDSRSRIFSDQVLR